MSLLDKILGRPLATSERGKESLSVWTGVPVLGLDALASTGYGPEAALTVLVPLGLVGLQYFPIIAVIILIELFTLYLSYRQTAAAYPGGGGAYIVASDNLGTNPGVWSAVMLLLNYLLNVAVAISAGIGAVVSAIPALHPFTLPLCLMVLITLTFVNLRGVRESGQAFMVPVIVFVVCLGAAIAIGLLGVWQSGGQPHPVVAPPKIPPATETLGAWILLAAFANGCTAATGIEAVSNAVPLFRKPTVLNAQRTLTVMMLILGLFLMGISLLCPAYHIGAMDETKPGYQTILSQLVAAVAGRGVFYYISLTSIFFVLTCSAQTSFTGFPRVCRLLAEDGFLPPYFANRGRRLVFSHGIIFLSVISGLLLIAFGGVTQALIPLFAVGAFGAFLFSQSGMVVHWLRKKGPGLPHQISLQRPGRGDHRGRPGDHCRGEIPRWRLDDGHLHTRTHVFAPGNKPALQKSRPKGGATVRIAGGEIATPHRDYPDRRLGPHRREGRAVRFAPIRRGHRYPCEHREG